MADENANDAGEAADDRRDFLKKAGKFAVTVPPAMAFLLTTTMSSSAIAISGGSSGSGSGPKTCNRAGQPPGCIPG